MKFIRKLDWKYRKPNAVERLRSCLRASRQKIAKLGSHVGGGDVLVAAGAKKTTTTTTAATAMTARNTIFKDKAVAACKDLENFHKISPPPPPPPPRHLRRATKETFMQDGSFHEAVGSVLLLAELFAIMPVKGVKAKSPADLSFSWLSIRTIYSILLIVMTFVDMALTVYMVLDKPISFNSVEPIIFRGSNIIVCISFLNLAKNWPVLMDRWRAVEKQLPGYESQMEKGKLATSIRMVVFVAMMLSLVEHFLSIIANIHYANFCPITDDPIENFFLTTGSQIFYVFPYSAGLGWYGKILNFAMTFGWNYMDSFVMVMSIGLTDLFKQVNANLEKHKGMHMPESFWSEGRIQYRSICILCEQVDNAISVITMVSFSNNLYFICIQLLKSLNKMPSFAHALYFYFSLFFLLGRTLAVSLYSADVHDESKNPLRYLRCVPKDSWCQEVKRFSEDISTDLVALSGMKFFHLTRKLVLSVAGTIVTYELVLIQFREDGNVWDCERNDLM